MKRGGTLPAILKFVLIILALRGVTLAQSSQELMQSGMTALKSNDFKRAEQIFTVLAKKDPSVANLHYLAIAELSAGDVELAIAKFKQAQRLGDDSPNLHYYLGLAYMQHQEQSAGIREFRVALAKDPKLLPAEAALGIALLNAKQPKEALPHLGRARAHSPHDPEIAASFVRAEFDAGDAKKALAGIDEAVDMIPDNPRLDATLAFLCLHHQVAQRARQLLESASELMPQDTTLKLLLAEASLKAGEPVETLAVLKGMPESAGNGGEVAYLRGSAYLLGGKTEEAAPYLSAAIAADPTNVDYLFAYAGLQEAEELYSDALATLSKARKLDPQSDSIPYQMAVTYALMRRYGEATQACQDALYLTGRRDDVFFLMGVIKLEQEDFRAAEDSLRLALASNPNVALYHAALGVALFEMSNLAGSQQELNRALVLDVQATPAYLWRARVLVRQAQLNQAIADYVTYTTLAPDATRAYQELEAVYRQTGQAELAAATHVKYVALKAEKGEDDRASSFLDQLWLTRIREGLGRADSAAH